MQMYAAMITIQDTENAEITTKLVSVGGSASYVFQQALAWLKLQYRFQPDSENVVRLEHRAPNSMISNWIELSVAIDYVAQITIAAITVGLTIQTEHEPD